MREVGWHIVEQKEHFFITRFYDTGALVYYLKAIPWEVPDFSIDKYFDKLVAIHTSSSVKAISTFPSTCSSLERARDSNCLLESLTKWLQQSPVPVLSNILHLRETPAQRVHLRLHILAADGVVHQLGQLAHGTFIHTEARHLRHADAQAGRVARVAVAGQHIVVHDDIVGLQALSHLDAPTPLRDTNCDHVAFRVTELARLHRRAQLIQAAPQRLRIAHNLQRVVAAKRLHLANGDQQRRQRVQVMVTGGAGENTPIGGGPVFLLVFLVQVAQDHPALRAGERLVRAARHPRRPLLQRRLKLAARDQSKHVGAIIEQRDLLSLAESGNLLHRLREEEQALAHHHDLR